MRHFQILRLLIKVSFVVVSLRATPAVAGTTYNVNINTSSLVGHPAGPFYLFFAVTDGSGLSEGNNSVTISSINFSGGSALGNPSSLGGVTGDLGSTVSMTDSGALNFFSEAFSAGQSLSFALTVTNNLDDGPIPDGFAFYILDNSGRPIPTLSPGSDYFIGVALAMNGGAPLVFASDISRPPSSGNPILIPAPTLRSDTTPPVTIGAVSPTPNANGWNNTNITVTLNSTDNELGGTGVKQITYSATGAQTIASTIVAGGFASVTVNTEGITTITFFGTDNAGNVESARTLMIQLDKTPPTITPVRTPPPNANSWNNTSVTVNFQCADNLSGLAAGSPPAPTTLSSEAAGQSVTGTCTDLAGNSASATASVINIDMHPPIFACVPAAADGLWHATNQVFACSAQDSLSGLSNNSPASFSLVTTVPAGTEVANASTTAQGLCDQAGNCVTGGPISGNMVDRKPPTISISTPGNGATYAANQSVNAAYACTDLGSGVATCVGTVANGSKVDTAPNGLSTPKTFIVNSTDKVGNPASQSISYTISCHYVALGINPSTVIRGSAITVTGDVMSCTPHAQTISEKLTLTGPLGPSCTKTSTVMFTTPSFTIQPGTSKSVSFPFLIPKNACAGTYTTTSTTLQGGTAIDSTSTTLTVQ